MRSQNLNPNLNYHTDMSNINCYPNFNLNLKLECRTLSPPSGSEINYKNTVDMCLHHELHHSLNHQHLKTLYTVKYRKIYLALIGLISIV